MVNTKNKWVWVVNLFSYSYILYKYYFSGVSQIDETMSSLIWIPLDCILTFNIMLYQIFYSWQES